MPHIICAAIGNEQTEGLERARLVMKVESLSGHGGILSSGEKAGALTWGPGDCRTGLLQCSQRNWTYSNPVRPFDCSDARRENWVGVALIGALIWAEGM